MARYRCLLAAPLLILLLQLLLLQSPGEAAAAAAGAEHEQPVHWRLTDAGPREAAHFKGLRGHAVPVEFQIGGSRQSNRNSDASRGDASDSTFAERNRQSGASVERLEKRTYFDPMGYGKKKRTYFDPMGYGKKKRTYFDPMGYGKKKRTYFDPMGYGKKKRTYFDPMGYGKKKRTYFDPMGYGKKKRTYFDPMGYGKKRAYINPMNSKNEDDSSIDQNRYNNGAE